MQTDVIIIGGGIAGAVLALLLSRSNIQTIILQRNSRHAKSIFLGESLPPTSRPMLQRLRLEHYLESAPHFKSYGYQSVWGSNELIDNEFEKSYGAYGWKVDKRAWIDAIFQSFDHTIVPCQQITNIDVSAEGVKVKYLADENEHFLQAKYIVDATGRSSFVASKLGDSRFHSDDLVAYCCKVKAKSIPQIKRPVFVESFEHGWIIISQLDDHYQALNLFTRSNTGIGSRCKQLSEWKNLLKSTQYARHLIPNIEDVKINVLSAGSSILKKMAGKKWLAIGDAAMAFDPLASHGMTTAIYSAEQAAKAIEDQLTRKSTTDFSAYTLKLRSIYGTFMQEKERIYAKEKRWTGAFWE